MMPMHTHPTRPLAHQHPRIPPNIDLQRSCPPELVSMMNPAGPGPVPPSMPSSHPSIVEPRVINPPPGQQEMEGRGE